VRRRRFVLAAWAATAVIAIAISPVLAAIPAVERHFPEMFDRLFPLSYIGMPGMLISRLFSDEWNKAAIPIAVIGAWVCYFGLFFAADWLVKATRGKRVSR
jgi:hypothetical protein